MKLNHTFYVPGYTQPSMWNSDDLTFPVIRASSTGRCNTIQCGDSTMLPREKRSVWLNSVKT